MTTFDWSNCTHPIRHRFGYQKESRKPRWVCGRCKQTWTDGARDGRLERLAKLGELFKAGATVAQAMRVTGYTHVTVRRYYKMLAEYSGMKPANGHQRYRTHCPQGHAYTAGNTYRSRGWRACKQCRREKYLRRKAEKCLN